MREKTLDVDAVWFPLRPYLMSIMITPKLTFSRFLVARTYGLAMAGSKVRLQVTVWLTRAALNTITVGLLSRLEWLLFTSLNNLINAPQIALSILKVPISPKLALGLPLRQHLAPSAKDHLAALCQVLHEPVHRCAAVARPQDAHLVRDEKDAAAEANVRAEVEAAVLRLRGVLGLGLEVPAENGGVKLVGCSRSAVE